MKLFFLLLMITSVVRAEVFGLAAQPPAGVQESEQCMDFSGNWKGRCVFSTGASFSLDLAIEQKGCQTIAMNGMSARIGGHFLWQQILPSAEGAKALESASGSLRWNDAKTELNIEMIQEAQSLAPISRTLMTSTEAVYKMVDKKLVCTQRVAAIGPPASSIVCEYTK
ncbi:MAG: hypothetical protein HYR96_08230 [Deltaproteobacteria bacterium]|nr:hypothetical protein [Deltaproteobacteria bacterium]MBI3293494.1 hypothetical protein [Deltaproteobacteria bacterium]